MTDDASIDVKESAKAWEDRVRAVRTYYEGLGYRVHSGFQFGCELVLYADDPSKVHSDFCVHVLPEDGTIDWRQMQSLVRLMPDLHKTLLLAMLSPDGKSVQEMAFTSEHAQFRQKHLKRVQQQAQAIPGRQTKKKKQESTTAVEEMPASSNTRENDVDTAIDPSSPNTSDNLQT
jgi:hypothetical protein